MFDSAVKAVTDPFKDLGGGQWMGQSNYQAKPYEYDPTAFQNKATPVDQQRIAQAMATANDFTTPAATAQQVTGAALNTDRADEARYQQMQLAQALQQRATGLGGPSVAEQQLRQSTDQNNQAALALAMSNPSVNPAMAARNAQIAAAQNAQGAAGQAATLRAGETISAQGQQAGVLSGVAGQDITVAGQNAAMQQQATLANQAAALDAAKANQAAELTSEQQKLATQQWGVGSQNQLDTNQFLANMQLQKLKGEQALGANQLNQNTASQNAAAQSNAVGGILGGGAAGAALAMKFMAEGGVPQPLPLVPLKPVDIAPALRVLSAGKGKAPKPPGTPMAGEDTDFTADITAAEGGQPGSLKAQQVARSMAVDNGRVQGPGGPRSDVIPARVSNDEFILSADGAKAAEEHFGPKFLEALNELGKAKGAIEREHGVKVPLHALAAAVAAAHGKKGKSSKAA